ncbi:hypothetical protein V2G26_017312 [Clonostachys chloroleuca]
MTRRRQEQNRNPAAGMRNRRQGLGKKAHEYFRFYHGRVLVFIQDEDGQSYGYESHRGLYREISSRCPDNTLWGPDQFDRVCDRMSRETSSSSSEYSEEMTTTTGGVAAPKDTPTAASTKTTRLTPTRSHTIDHGTVPSGMIEISASPIKKARQLSSTKKKALMSLLDECFS